jgi:hypothetical protein
VSNTLDSEDADGSISCYGCETGLDRVTSKAVAATLLAHTTRRIHYLNERTVTVAATVEADRFTADRLLIY